MGPAGTAGGLCGRRPLEVGGRGGGGGLGDGRHGVARKGGEFDLIWFVGGVRGLGRSDQCSRKNQQREKAVNDFFHDGKYALKFFDVDPKGAEAFLAMGKRGLEIIIPGFQCELEGGLLGPFV